MNKRILFFGNPYHLSVRLQQLVVQNKKDGTEKIVPVEDVGCIVLEHPQISFTLGIMQELASRNVAVVICNQQYMPASMLFHLDSHQTQQERYRWQVEASKPLKKQLWQFTIKAKINNQANLLELAGLDGQALYYLAGKVQSGDNGNVEAKAARVYWPKLLGKQFTRERLGVWPNPLLNYGYAVLRAMTARSLAASGLLPALGIHHHNRYNAFCLADDIMEPFRPFVDKTVLQIITQQPETQEITQELKQKMIGILLHDTRFKGKRSPLQVAVQKCTASLARSFEENRCLLQYAEFL